MKVGTGYHPLVIGIVTSNNSRINLIYEQKKIARSKARASGDWEKYVFLYERPFRVDALLKAAKNGLRKSPSEFWALMGRVWIDTETARRHPIKWRRLWDEPIEGQRGCMAEEDLCIFDSLPEQIVVWRGASHKRGLAGFSWTLDQETAAFFARRFCSQSRVPLLAKGIVEKRDVLAYFGVRGESEIIATKVSISSITELTVVPSDSLECTKGGETAMVAGTAATL